MYAKVITFPNSIDCFPRRPIRCAKCSLMNDIPVARQNLVEKIRDRITSGKVEISPSAYDTAWVAMVPSREYSGRPSFPQCVDWIMENQNPNGSWGLNPGDQFLLKDSLSCTLACLLALSKWNIGNQLVQRGLDFIGSNGMAATHEDQLSPTGFDIVFPAMISYAKKLDLNLPLAPRLLHSLLQISDSQIRKCNWEYVAEGLIEDDSCNWKQIIRAHQRSNGSLFNSPATTAAAVIQCRDDKCFDYLVSILKNSNGWVPTIYPMDIYVRLNMIDALERLGIGRFFRVELDGIFDDIYRNWQDREEEIFSNVTCQALAFRLLRMKGYDVSSDELSKFVDEESVFGNISMQHSGVDTVLELYRASQIRINEEESTLEKIHAWTKPFLKHHLLKQTIRDKRLEKQVEYDLKNFYGTLDRFQNRRTIDLYDAQTSQMAKTAFRYVLDNLQQRFHSFLGSRLQNLASTIPKRIGTAKAIVSILACDRESGVAKAKSARRVLAMEYTVKMRWFSNCRLDLLCEGRDTIRANYIITAAVIVDPKLSMARIAYAQMITLMAVFDDFFDRYGSKEEVFTIVDLIREWKPAATYDSKKVEIMFTALYATLNGIAVKVYDEQGYCAKQQLINMWVELLGNAMKEKDSLSGNNMSTLEEYLSFASDTVGVKNCVMTAIQFLGLKLSKEIWTSTELSTLCTHGGAVCRLLNDLKTYKREHEENTLNSVSLLTVGGGISEEEAVGKVEEALEYHKRKAMQLASQTKRSIVPRECRELVWKTCMIGYCLYGHDGGGDEYSSPHDILNDMNAMMFEPFPDLSSS